MKRGFNSKEYIKEEIKGINKRIKKFNRLYLEIGGKLISDDHASRVLPGYNKKNKLKIIQKLKHVEAIYVVNSKDIASNKRLSKKLLTYKKQTLQDLKKLKKNKIKVSFVVITRYQKEKETKKFKETLEKLGYPVILYKDIKNYNKNIPKIIKSFKERLFIPVKEQLIVITGPAGNSGKMSVALSQILHEKKRKSKSGFAKLETFPVHDLSLKHPINIAYEAATADLKDENQIDPFHKKEYKIDSVNYNRDIENYKLLRKITKRKKPFGYKSPTDMGINKISSGIIDDEICRKAAINEIFNRLERYKSEKKYNREKRKTILRMIHLINKI